MSYRVFSPPAGARICRMTGHFRGLASAPSSTPGGQVAQVQLAGQLMTSGPEPGKRSTSSGPISSAGV